MTEYRVTIYPELDERGKPLPGFTSHDFATRGAANEFYGSVSTEAEMVTLCKVQNGRRVFPAEAQRTRGTEVFDA